MMHFRNKKLKKDTSTPNNAGDESGKKVKPNKKLKFSKKDIVTNYLNKLSQKLRNIKIQYRMGIFSGLVLLIPLLAVSLLLLIYSSNIIQSKVKCFSSQDTDLMGKSISNELGSYENEILSISNGEGIQNILQDIKNKDALKDNLINEVFKNLISDKNITAIELADINGQFLYGDEYDKNVSEAIIKAADKNGGFPNVRLSVINGKHVLSFYRKIKSLTSGEDLGYIWIDVDETSIYNSYKSSNNYDFIIIDSKGTVISGANKNDIGNTSKYINIIKNININSNSKSLNVTINNNKYLANYYPIDKTQWYGINLVPFSYINKESSEIKVTIIIISIIAFIVAMIMSLLISRSIQNPLKKLMNSIKGAKEGKLNVYIEDYNSDEFGIVTKNFNEMIKNLKELIINIKEEAQNVSSNATTIEEVSNYYHGSSEDIVSVIFEVSKDASAQVNQISASMDYMDNLGNAIYEVEESLKATMKFIENQNVVARDTNKSLNLLKERSKAVKEASEVISESIRELSLYMDNIKSIVDIIIGISRQTNLLALNASIESARAGDEGKGFTLVANEVKKLAEQSKEASDGINKIVIHLSERIVYTYQNSLKAKVIIDQHEDAVNKAELAVETISNFMEETNGILFDITNSFKDIHEVKDNTIEYISSISGISQETAAITEQINVSTEEEIEATKNLLAFARKLNNMAKELNNSVEIFKV